MSETSGWSEAERSRVREVADAIGEELSRLGGASTPAAHRSSVSKLAASWAELLELLALGPAPETRVCHRCQRVGRRAATRCGYCWVELPLLAQAALP